jgi:hypothetical protein
MNKIDFQLGIFHTKNGKPYLLENSEIFGDGTNGNNTNVIHTCQKIWPNADPTMHRFKRDIEENLYDTRM